MILNLKIKILYLQMMEPIYIFAATL